MPRRSYTVPNLTKRWRQRTIHAGEVLYINLLPKSVLSCRKQHATGPPIIYGQIRLSSKGGGLEILSITTSPHKKRRKGKRVGSLNSVSKLIESGVEKSIISFAASRSASTTTKLPQLHPLHHRRQLKKKAPSLFLVYPPGSPSMYNHKQKNWRTMWTKGIRRLWRREQFCTTRNLTNLACKNCREDKQGTQSDAEEDRPQHHEELHPTTKDWQISR